MAKRHTMAAYRSLNSGQKPVIYVNDGWGIHAMRKRILSISYDEMLLITRQQILSANGYEVASALGFAEAKQLCQRGPYDLAIMGHSIPQKDKIEMMKDIAEHCRVPVLALLRTNEAPLEGATESVHSFEPQTVLAAVNKLLGSNSTPSTKKTIPEE